MEDSSAEIIPPLPDGGKLSSIARAGINAIGGAIPFAGGLFGAAAGAWSEHEQNRVNQFLHHWLQMLAAEMKEKEKTILEIMARIDVSDEKVADRIESEEYQSLLRRAFRDWAGAESEEKRIMVRNLLTNAAAITLTSDDVIKLFLQWIKNYSEFHFQVIGKIYNHAGTTRGNVWRGLNKPVVREDSSDADLFRLLFRDLSTGGIIRQHRETDYQGNFISKLPSRTPQARGSSKVMKSAFDDEEAYELTALGEQFVHYAMTNVPPKLEFTSEKGASNE